MASSSSLQLWNLMSLMLIMMMIMVKSTVDADSDAPVVKSFQPSAWKPSHATSFYDDYSAQETMGGACGYGNLITNGYGTDNAALSSVLFNGGYACGECFQIKCSTQAKDCYSAVVTVTATDLCPPNWGQDSNNGGWCNPPRTHFDMAKSAFDKITFWRGAGIVPVLYRRVACIRPGGLRFSLQGNRYWVLVFVTNVGGAGDIASMSVGTINGWISMRHNRGASYQAFAGLEGQALSFRVTSYTTKETIIAWNVAPSDWTVGATYQSTVNFH